MNPEQIISKWRQKWNIKPYASNFWWETLVKETFEEGKKEGISESTYPLAFKSGFEIGKKTKSEEIKKIITEHIKYDLPLKDFYNDEDFREEGKQRILRILLEQIDKLSGGKLI